MTLEEMREFLLDELREEKNKMLRNEENHYGYLFMILNDIGITDSTDSTDRKRVVKLGQTTTGTGKGVRYLWLVKNMNVYRNYSKKECYEVLAFNGNGWFTMFGGTLAACRSFIGNETVVNV